MQSVVSSTEQSYMPLRVGQEGLDKATFIQSKRPVF